MNKQATTATMNPSFNLSSQSEMTDFEILIDDMIAGSGPAWMEDVFYNANGRHIDQPADELLSYLQEMEKSNEDFWGLDGSGYDAITNDPGKQWAYIKSAIDRELVSILVQVIEKA